MLPPYVAVPDAPIFASSGYLTPAYDPFAVGGDPNQEAFRVRDLTPPDQLTLDRLRRRRGMVKKLDGFAHDVPGTPLTSSRDQFADRAYDLLTSIAAQAAFRMDEETAAIRDHYGRTTVGQSLPAGPPADRGGGLVRHDQRPRAGQLGWDTHAQNFPTIKNTLAPPLDKGLAALARRPLGARACSTDARRDDGRIRPDAQDQPQGRPRPPRPRQLASCSPARAFPGGLVLGRTDAKGDSPPIARSPRPTSPPRSTQRWGSTPTTSSRRPTAARSAWSTSNGSPPKELL